MSDSGNPELSGAGQVAERLGGNDSQVTPDMRHFRVRLFTKIPPNVVLVSQNKFFNTSESVRIQSKTGFHLPWTESRFVSLEDHHMDLKEESYELGDTGFAVTADINITWRVKPIEADDMTKPTLGDKWRGFFDRLRRNKAGAVVKGLVLGAAVVGASIVATPIAGAAILAATAGYVSFGKPDQDWIRQQGAYNRVYNAPASMKALEDVIFAEVRAYYARHSYDEVQSQNVSLNHPEFSALRAQLAAYTAKYGIEVTRFSILSSKSPDSQRVLQRQKDAQVKAKEMVLLAEATATETKLKAGADYEAEKLRIEARRMQVQALIDQGFSPAEIAKLLEAQQYSQGGANLNVVKTVDGTPVTPVVDVSSSGPKAK